MQPTYRPSKLARARRCGFRARNKTPGGATPKSSPIAAKCGRKRLAD